MPGNSIMLLFSFLMKRRPQFHNPVVHWLRRLCRPLGTCYLLVDHKLSKWWSRSDKKLYIHIWLQKYWLIHEIHVKKKTGSDEDDDSKKDKSGKDGSVILSPAHNHLTCIIRSLDQDHQVAVAIDEVLYSVLAVPKSSAAARWLWLFLANGSLSRFSELWALAPVPSPNFLLFLIQFFR